MKRVYLPHHKASGFSLLEISVSMVILSYILLMAGTTLMSLIAQQKTVQARTQAYRLAQNLMETILSLPETQAKALEISESPDWTAHQRFSVTATWEPFTNSHFEKLTVEYKKAGISLVKLVSLTPHSS